MNEAFPPEVPLVAIFIGGKSSRMGGQDKGRLISPLSSKPIVEHLIAEAHALGLPAVLVGRCAGYDDLAKGTPRIDDAKDTEGPLAGMVGAARYAGERDIICLGCDMPYVSRDIVAQLLRAHPGKSCVAIPRGDAALGYEPFLCRWSAPELLRRSERLVRSGDQRLRSLFSFGFVAELNRSAELDRALQDWDIPADLEARSTQAP